MFSPVTLCAHVPRIKWNEKVLQEIGFMVVASVVTVS